MTIAQTQGHRIAERPVDELDAWLSSDDVFFCDPVEARRQLTRHLRAALAHHLNGNPRYRAYAEGRGFRLDELTPETLGSIPLLPSGIFKRSPELIRTATGQDVVISTSSGTRGTISRVPRDNQTVMRFFASVVAGVRELLHIEHSETFVYNIGPTVAESSHLWISYVMAGASLIHETEFYVRGGVFEADALIDDLRDASATNVPQIVVGPPPLIAEAARRLAASGPLPMADQRYLVTIGGWKRREGEMLNRDEFEALVVPAFGLAGGSRVRDAFNMVELNTAVVECSAKSKHCPPWLYASARDPRTLAVMDSGEPGVLAFLDPTPQSYPGFVLSDDFGVVDRNAVCDCGIVGDVLTIERRINRLESRGCAMKM